MDETGRDGPSGDGDTEGPRCDDAPSPPRPPSHFSFFPSSFFFLSFFLFSSYSFLLSVLSSFLLFVCSSFHLKFFPFFPFFPTFRLSFFSSSLPTSRARDIDSRLDIALASSFPRPDAAIFPSVFMVRCRHHGVILWHTRRATRRASSSRCARSRSPSRRFG